MRGDAAAQDVVGTVLMVALTVVLGASLAVVVTTTFSEDAATDASLALAPVAPGATSATLRLANGEPIALPALRVTLSRDGWARMARWLPWGKRKASAGEVLAKVSGLDAVKRGAQFQAWLASCRPAKDPPAGAYAGWWREEDDPAFTSSRTFHAMTRAYDALPGVEGHVVAMIAKHCIQGAPESTVLPLPPPDRLLVVGVETPAGTLILRASGEKGVQFLFPRAVARAHREAVWEGLAALAESAKAVVAVAGKKETPSASRVAPGEWWSHAAQNIQKAETEGRTVSAFSVAFHKWGTPRFVEVDALVGTRGREDFTEFPTSGMMRHYEPVLRARMEAQAAQMAAMRQGTS